MIYKFYGKNLSIDKDSTLSQTLINLTNKEQINCKKFIFLHQVHSKNVISFTNNHEIENYDITNKPIGDAIVTNQTGIAIGVVTADCAPILLFDKENKIIASCHAGWKGSKLGIVKETVNKMKEIGAKNIEAIIGPMIQKYSYEVSEEFYEDFLTENKNNKIFFEYKTISKYFFDLNAYVNHKLNEENIKAENNKIDTYSSDEFYSYRRSFHKNEDNNGRNISIIIL